jgi:hypothetical protein
MLHNISEEWCSKKGLCGDACPCIHLWPSFVTANFYKIWVNKNWPCMSVMKHVSASHTLISNISEFVCNEHFIWVKFSIDLRTILLSNCAFCGNWSSETGTTVEILIHLFILSLKISESLWNTCKVITFMHIMLTLLCESDMIWPLLTSRIWVHHTVHSGCRWKAVPVQLYLDCTEQTKHMLLTSHM